MPRNKPSTTWGDRTPPTTSWTTDILDLIWDTAIFTWDETELTWDQTSGFTAWMNTRYAFYVEDLTKTNVVDLTWEEVLWISGQETNKIDTNWQ